jgi:hypothetical protein
LHIGPRRREPGRSPVGKKFLSVCQVCQIAEA